jgi:hypothetical protein
MTVEELKAEIERLKRLVRAYQLELARVKELLHIQDFESLP